MPPKDVVPKRRIHITLPEAVIAQVDLLLWSEAEEGLPYGAYQEFFSARIQEFFVRKPLDLAPFLNEPAGACVIHADARTLSKLLTLLEGK